MDTATTTLKFYRHSLHLISFDEAITRIKINYGNLTIWQGKIYVLGGKFEPCDLMLYGVTFFGPFSLTLVATLCYGFCLTGIGAIVLASGVALVE